MAGTHWSAMWRMGLAELRNLFYPESNVAQRTSEPGIRGTLTPGEVADQRRDALAADQEVRSPQPSVLEGRMPSAEAPAPDRQRQMSMDRG